MVSPSSSPQQDRAPGRRCDRTQGDAADRESAFRPVLDDLAALQAYASHYLAARADGARYAVKKALGWTVLGIVAALAGAAVVIAAAVYLVAGIAAALTALFGGRAWAGELLTGLLLLALIGGGAYFAVRKWLAAAFDTVKKNYELRRRHEREAYGWDVAQRASGDGRTRPGGPT